jgi:hypothetical protein
MFDSAETLSDQLLEKWWWANELVEDASVGPTVNTRQATTEQSGHYDYLGYSATVDQYAYSPLWEIPIDADTDFATGSKFRFGIIWAGDNATSNTVEWQIGTRGRAHDEALKVTPLTTQLMNPDASGGSTYDVYFSQFLFASADDFNVADLACIRWGRLGSSGVDDDYAGQANLIMAGFQWNALAANNAQWS